MKVSDAISILSGAELNVAQQAALTRLMTLVDGLQSATRYEASVGGCECCGTWVEHETSNYGEWVKHQDIKVLLEEEL